MYQFNEEEYRKRIKFRYLIFNDQYNRLLFMVTGFLIRKNFAGRV